VLPEAGEKSSDSSSSYYYSYPKLLPDPTPSPYDLFVKATGLEQQLGLPA
jgi:hypothetical protein